MLIQIKEMKFRNYIKVKRTKKGCNINIINIYIICIITKG